MTTITTIIDPPLPTDTPAVFNTKAFDAWGDINTWAGQANTVAGEVNTNASTASTAATTATTQAGIATSASATAVSSKNEAVAARNEAVTLTERYQGALASDPALDKTGNPLTDGDWYVNTVTGFIRAYTVAGGWVSGISALAGVDSINGLTGTVNSPTQAEAEAGVEATKPMNALRTAQAIAALAKAKVIRSARTSNTAIASADSGKWIDITSGAFTQTFAAAATLGDGWWCYLGNSGTGDVTLDPDSIETIDGLTSYVMYPGEVRLVQCDGIAFRTIVLNSFYKEYTASGTFIKPPGYRMFEGFLWGAGASGSKVASYAEIRGGGGGCCHPVKVKSSSLSASPTVTIGAGGAAVSTNITGNSGGGSSFGGFFAGGGFAQYGGGVISGGGANDAPLRSDYGPGSINTASYFGGGTSGTADPSNVYSPARSGWGGGAGGNINDGSAFVGGASLFGGSGGAASTAGNGTAGSIPGGGGGATNTGTQSGAGARGELRLWGVI